VEGEGKSAQQHVGPESDHGDAVTLKPSRQLAEQVLQASGVRDQPASNTACRPGEHGSKCDEDHDRCQNDDRQRNKLGQVVLETSLRRPSQRNDEKCAGDRCQDGAAEVKGNENCDDCNRKADFFKPLHGSQTRRGACPPAPSKAMS
jgi:hypothetical protein